MQVIIDGTLNISREHYMDLALAPYIYNKKGGGISTSVFMDKEFVSFPRNYQKLSRTNKLGKVKILDNRVEAPLVSKLKLKSSFGLRDYQKNPVDEVVKNLRNKNTLNSCVLQAGTGFGKTYILPKIVQRLNQRTIILVDRSLLARQMFDEFKDNSEADVQMLSAKNKELGDVTITTFQFLTKNPDVLEKIKNDIGFVIVDECHVAPALTFAQIIAKFPAKYRLGLSATPTRSDGLTSIISDIFGGKTVIGDNPDKLTVNMIGLVTGISMFCTGKSDFAENFINVMTSKPILDILDLSIKAFKKRGRKMMIYSTYGVVQEATKKLMEANGLKVAIINSKVSHKKRDEIIKDFNEGSLDGLVSGVIMSKGISIHSLDTIISLSTHNKESLTQLIGRLRREYKGKQKPLYIDFGLQGSAIQGTIDRFDEMQSKEVDGDKLFRYSIEKYKQMLGKI